MPLVPGGDSGFPAGGSAGQGSGAGSGGGGTAPPGAGGGGVPAIPGPGGGLAKRIGSQMFRVVRLTPDRTEYGPTVFVNADDQVFVVPLRSNTANVFVATSGNSDAKFDPRLELTKTDNPVEANVQSLKEVGVYSTVIGEGVLIILNRRP